MFKIGQEIVATRDQKAWIAPISVKKNRTYIFLRYEIISGMKCVVVTENAGLWNHTGFKRLSDVLDKISLTELMEEPVGC